MRDTAKRNNIIAQAVFWVLCGFMLLGLRYPLVGRDDTLMPGAPNSLLLWSVFLAAIYSVATVHFTRSSFEKHSHFIFGVICYFIAGIVLMLGCLIFINGVLDRSIPQSYQTRIVEKKISRGKYGPDYYFIVMDWRNPADLVRLEVSRETYEGLNTSSGREVGETVTVTTLSGFLGYERLSDVR